MSLTRECWQQKHTQHAPSTKTECDSDYLYGWITNRHICKYLTKKIVNLRDIAGNTEEEERMYENRLFNEPKICMISSVNSYDYVLQVSFYCSSNCMYGQFRKKVTYKVYR